MIGFVAWLLGGLVLGVTSYWHLRAGGAGTTGSTLGAALLVVVAVVGVAAGVAAWAGRRR